MIIPVLILALSSTPPERGAEKLSVPIRTEAEAWRSSGFRMGIGYGADAIFGAGAAPNGVIHAVLLRLGLRIDDRWSLFAGLRYGLLPGEAPGLSFSGTIEPTLHLTDAWSVSIGVGAAGFVLPTTGASTPVAAGDLSASRTLPSAGPLLGACVGIGAQASVRAEYQLILSSALATGPALQLDLQWTACTESMGTQDPDTGDAIELRQFWQHTGVTLGWLLWWR